MARDSELRKNWLVAELDRTDSERRKNVRAVNNWYQWVWGLPPAISIPAQLLDFGFPRGNELDGFKLTNYAVELVQELGEIMPNASGRYAVDQVVYHAHVQDNKPKFTGLMHLKVGSFFVPAKFEIDELVIEPARDWRNAALEIKPGGPSLLRTMSEPVLEVCFDHDRGALALWRPAVLEDRPTPIEPMVIQGSLINSGVLDPFTKMVARKHIRNSELRKKSNEGDDPLDITQYKEVKDIGVFEVHHNVAEFDWVKTELGFLINEGERFLEFHLPYEERYEGAYSKENFFRSVRNSFMLMAEYIDRHNLETKWVIGTTDERLARAGRIFGFQAKEVPIQNELATVWELEALEHNPRFQTENRPARKKLRPFGKILMVYQSMDDFLTRFGMRHNS